MAEALEQQGHEAFVDEDFQRALDLYNQAVALAPSNPNPLVSRAQAHIKLGQFTDAINDTKKAIELNPSLPKAHLRKGIAFFSLEEYESAKVAFEQGALLGNNAQFQDWISKCDQKLQAEQSMAKINLNTKPAAELPVVAPEPSPVVARAPEASPSRLAPPKFRHEWYQSQAEIVVTIFAKGINPDDADIEFGEQLLSVLIRAPNPNEEPYVWQPRLFGKVDVSGCKYTFLSMKIEIRLKKGEDIQWNALEFDKRQAVVQKNAGISSAPSTSTRKNWDSIVAQVKKEEKDEKLEGDAALNKLFREIYSNGDEDTRRAMNKSFTESSGTHLSTNWGEVGSKKVEGSAPTGMEMKKWEI